MSSDPDSDAGMFERPGTIRLDLADPQFSPDVAEMFAGAAAFAPMLPLEFDAVHAAAIEQLGGGFTDFGAQHHGDYREALTWLLESLRTEAGLSGMGHVSLHTQIVGMLKNRLLLADLVGRHPEIRDIPIERPIIIVGQPRTGTTHLHNLLAADPGLRSLHYWESQQPVPIPAEVGIEPDPRLERCGMGLAFLDLALPEFKRMHEMTVDHVHEEIQLLANSFSTMLFETMATMPSYREWYRSTDQTPHYEYMKLQLQAMTFLRGGDRWLLKSPQHLEQLPVLNGVFPDAVVLITHRDPVPVTTSLLTMLGYTARLQVEAVDLHKIGSYWAERNAQMIESCQRDRATVPVTRTMDVIFHEFMADDLSTVGDIYELADQPLDDRARAAQADYLAHHLRDRHGKVVYDFEQFGVDPASLRSRFEPYVERFGVRREWYAAGPP